MQKNLLIVRKVKVMKKITYEISKNKTTGDWRIIKNLESDHGLNSVCIFNGTKKECQEKLKELKEVKNDRPRKSKISRIKK